MQQRLNSHQPDSSSRTLLQSNWSHIWHKRPKALCRTDAPLCRGGGRGGEAAGSPVPYTARLSSLWPASVRPHDIAAFRIASPEGNGDVHITHAHTFPQNSCVHPYNGVRQRTYLIGTADDQSSNSLSRKNVGFSLTLQLLQTKLLKTVFSAHQSNDRILYILLIRKHNMVGQLDVSLETSAQEGACTRAPIRFQQRFGN